MSCGCSGTGPGRWSPEFTKQFKPESNQGCCSSVNSNTCKTPSRAKPGSALWDWEQIHGKLVTTVYKMQDAQGHFSEVVKKITCPIDSPQKSRYGCCSFRYRTIR